MADKKKKKKVNGMNMKECEDVINKQGGAVECLYIQHVMAHYQMLKAKKSFDKN